MGLDERLEQVTVLGAAGKMGSGISLLIAQEMTRVKNRPGNRSKSFKLNMIDVRPAGLDDALEYVRSECTRTARVKADDLRALYPGQRDLETPEQLAEAFVDDTLSLIHTDTDLGEANGSRLVFEVIPEDERLKIDALRTVGNICPDSYFLSNTSSIPIEFLDREADLDGRLIGCHFFNPPAVQKLLELIPSSSTRPELTEIAQNLGQRLGKTVVFAGDVAGFIGSGHFVREALYALGQADHLASRLGAHGGIYAINKISQKGLVRPMGTFQLLDYVGLDVIQSILRVMTHHIEKGIYHSPLIDQMSSNRLTGGQQADGTQKDGFFQYEGRRAVSVYASDQEAYLPLGSGSLKQADQALGPISREDVSWRRLLDDPDRDRRLRSHFARLSASDSLGARLAVAYLTESGRIAQALVAKGIAKSPEDVNTAIVTGFHHLYGPINAYAPPVSIP